MGIGGRASTDGGWGPGADPSSVTTAAPGGESCPPGWDGNFQLLTTGDLVQYLEDVLDVVRDQPQQWGGDGGDKLPSQPQLPQLLASPLSGSTPTDSPLTGGVVRIRLNERHRRGMVRAILGTSNGDFRARLRQVQTGHQWHLAASFLTEHKEELLLSVSPSDAPQFHDLLRSYDNAPPGEATVATSGVRNGPHEGSGTSLRPATVFQKEGGLLPSKFFSTLARGRMYQGRFDRLLGDIRPDLVDRYLQIVSDVAEADLLRLLVEEVEALTVAGVGRADADRAPDAVDLLRRCLAMPFVAPPRQAADGGRSSGRRGEANLSQYLARSVLSDAAAAAANMDNGDDVNVNTAATTANSNRSDNIIASNNNSSNSFPTGKVRVLSPVWVQPRAKNGRSRYTANSNGRNGNKQEGTARYVLEVPVEVMMPDMTAEFDAMVVEQVHDPTIDGGGGDTCVIRQVWDAKATADIPAILDVLSKKVASLRRILGPNCQDSPLVNLVCLEPQAGDGSVQQQVFGVATAQAVRGGGGSTSHPAAIEGGLPLIGIFANRMPPARSAARSMQVVTCERLLETDIGVVRSVLRDGSGTMEAPTEVVVASLERLISKVKWIQPVVVVAVLPSDV